MSASAILGLLALNVWFLTVGGVLLFALRGYVSWGEALRLGGVAYMLGVASTGVALVWELVAGLDLSIATILGTGAAIAVVAGAVALRLGRRLPPRPRFRVVARLSLVGSVFAALVVVYSEALFRSGRLAGLYEFDAWSFWVPKAKAIYYFGGFDREVFSELPHHGYPPLVPVVEAAAFRFMGSADVVTLHLQFWFLLLGFAAALVGLLAPRVRPLFLWPPLLLVLVTPHVVGHVLQPEGDFLLDELLAIGALLVGLWLIERRDWELVAATVLLAAAMLSKREGYLFGACIVFAALGVTWREARAWPRVLLVGFIAAAATIPWRGLLAHRHLSAEGPEAGGTGLFRHADLAWPSLRLTLSTVFDYHLWLVVVPVALLAVGAAMVAGARRLPGYVALVYAFGVAGLTWVTWSFPSIPLTKDLAINPIVRLTGWLVLTTPAVVPLVLAATWRGRDSVEEVP